MYKVDYGKSQQDSSALTQPPSAPDNNNTGSGWFPVRGAQAPPQSAPPNANTGYPAPNGYGQAYPQNYQQAAQPAMQVQPAYYPQAHGYQPQGYQPLQRGSQPHLHTASRSGSGWQPSVMSVPAYTQQANAASTIQVVTGPKQRKTKGFRVQLFILAILHAACAGTFLGIEIWAMNIKAWLASVALGIWAAFPTFLACAVISVVLACRPKKQIVMNIAFGLMIAGTIVAVGLAAVAVVGISFENNINYTNRDHYWPYRVPTHIVKVICASIEIVVCIWEIIIIKMRFDPKTPSKKNVRPPASAVASYHMPPSVSQRSIGQPDVLSGLSMPSSVQLNYNGPEPAVAPSRAFKALPGMPNEQPVAEPVQPDVINRSSSESEGELPEVADFGLMNNKPPVRPARRRDQVGSDSRQDEVDEPAVNASRRTDALQSAPAPVPPRPAKRHTTAEKQRNDPTGYESRSEDEVENIRDRDRPEKPPQRLPPRPGRSKPAAPPPRDPSPPPPSQPAGQPNAFDDPFNAPITRPAQSGVGSQKRAYYYTDAQ